MHNGCLLLLAFVAVFQPIASYSERGLVNGRQQRCDYRTSLRDPGVYFHGTYRFTKSTVEDRRLNQRDDIRELHRNEVREESLRIASSIDRRARDTLERNRDNPTRTSRNRVSNVASLRREVRLVPNRDERNEDSRRERLSRVQKARQSVLPGNRYQSRIQERFNEPRVSVESPKESRRNGNNAEENRETRISTNRARNDLTSRLSERRIARERDQEIDTRRSVSTIQVDRNADQENLERRFRNREFRSSLASSNRVNRAYSVENTRSERDDTSRRSVDDPSHLRDISRNQRQSLSAERQNIRELQIRTSDNRRDAQSLERAERNARLTRAVRSVDDRLSRTDRRASRIIEHARPAENRREYRTMTFSNRAAEVLRDIQNTKKDSCDFQLNLKRTAEIRGETRNINRDICAFDRQRSSENLMARMITRERVALDDRSSRNSDREIRTQELEPVEHNRGVTNDEKNTFLVRKLERVSEIRRDAHNYRALRSIDRLPSQEIRRNIRNLESRTVSTERSDNSRRDIRNVDSRAFRTERNDERQRNIRNTESRTFRTEHIGENRRDINNVESRVFKTEGSDEGRRDIRNPESRTFRTERAVESHRDIRNAEARAFRIEHTGESRRDLRDAESRTSRIELDADSRREARDFIRQSRYLDRIASNQRQNIQNNERETRMRERTLDSRRNIQNTERQFRAKDERIINNRRPTRSLEREFRLFDGERSIKNRLNRRSDARDSSKSLLERPENRREQTTENRIDTRNIRRESRSLDTQESRRVQSREINSVSYRDDEESRNNRATERLSKRDSRDSKRTSIHEQESRREKTERNNLPTRDQISNQREAETRRSFNADFSRKREVLSIRRNPTQTEDETPAMNWQYVFYTLQGIYICGVLMQLMNDRSVDKKTRVSWWSAPQHLIKAD